MTLDSLKLALNYPDATTLGGIFLDFGGARLPLCTLHSPPTGLNQSILQLQ